MQIIVLGMHRSGTSVVSRLLNMMGVYFAPDDFSHNRDILLGRQTGNQIVKLENKNMYKNISTVQDPSL